MYCAHGMTGVDAVTLPGALGAIDALVARREGGVVVTPNVDHVVLADENDDLRAAYAEADLSLADGQPIVWSSRLLGQALPAKVSGADLLLPLMDHAAGAGWRVFLLGGEPGVAEEAAERLRARGTEIVGTAAPWVRGVAAGPDPEGDAAAEAVRACRPHLVVVAFGAPKQEIWMHRHRRALAPSVLVGLGASLDFVAGRIRRAPRWVSGAGLEWLWRLGREPRRLWRRYLLRDPRFLAILLRTVRERRASRP